VTRESKTVTKTFGYKNFGTTWYELAENTKVVGKYVLGDAAEVTSFQFFGSNKDAARETNLRGVIYSDNGGVPDKLIAFTEELNVTDDTKQKRTVSFTEAVSLSAGTYWLGIFFEVVGAAVTWHTRYGAGSTNQWATTADTYSDGASEAFGAPSYENRSIISFVTYTTTVNMRYPPAIEGNTVTTTVKKMGIRFQEKSFAAADRIWVFYIDHVGAFDHPAKYTSSADDGVTWTTPVTLMGAAEYTGENIYAVAEGDYVHLFIRYLSGSTRIRYRRGLLASDGSITWTAAWTDAWDAGATTWNADFYACLDTEGYPWITWEYGNVLMDIPVYITKSSNNNGIWATEGGYPFEISTAHNGKGYTNSFMIPLLNGKLYVFYFHAQAGTEASDKSIRGKLWNGVSWTAEEEVADRPIICQYSTGYESWSRGVTADADDNIHLVYLDWGITTFNSDLPKAFSWNLQYVKRTWGTGWGAEEVIEPDILYRNASPAITIHQDIIRVFWTGSSPDIIFCKSLSGGHWSSNVYLIEELTDTIPNADDYGYDGVINSYPQLYEGKVGLLWMTGSSTPFTINFGIIQQFVGGAYEGKYRVKGDFFNRVKRALTGKFPGNPSFEVYWYALTLGDADATTGWFTEVYDEEPIEMIVLPQSAQKQAINLGTYVVNDALGLTLESVKVGHRIETKDGSMYLVKTVTPVLVGDTLKFWNCDLELLRLYREGR